MKPIQFPINGQENLGNRDQPHQALAHFYAAFNQGNLEMMSQNWLNDADSIMSNPVGGVKRGWDEIRPVYEKIFAARPRSTVEFFDYTLHVTDALFYAVGRERGTFSTVSGEKERLDIRTTRVFKKVGPTWKQVRHHGSFENGDSLKSYQAAV